jgi:hypothetical protein
MENVTELLKRIQLCLGPPRNEVDHVAMARALEDGGINRLVGAIGYRMRIPYNVEGIRTIQKPGSNTPAWIVTQFEMLEGFRRKILGRKVFIDKSFLAEAPQATVILAMAHEMSHIIVDKIRMRIKAQSASDVERCVDLIAMYLGVATYYRVASSYMRGNNTVRVGYLTDPEIQTAVDVIGSWRNQSGDNVDEVLRAALTIASTNSSPGVPTLAFEVKTTEIPLAQVKSAERL